jgi:hypothetical protein
VILADNTSALSVPAQGDETAGMRPYPANGPDN